MAEATPKENLETPPDHSEETPEIGLEDISEVLSPSNEDIDKTGIDEGKTDKAPISEVKIDATPVAKPETKDSKEQTVVEPTEKETIESLKKQLELYQTIYGNAQPQQRTPQEQQEIQKPTQQQQRDILDSLEVNESDLVDLLSGDVTRAKPIIQKFVRTAIQATMIQQAQVAEYQQKTHQYINGVQEIFYDRFKDLNELRPLVKLAGDQVQAEYQSRGIVKYPHDLIDEIGNRARKLRDEFKVKFGGVATPPPPKTVVRQGEVGSTRLTPPTPEKLTEQEQEMLDLINN